MHQLTISELKKLLEEEERKGNGDKLLITSDDEEGNGYHGLWCGCTPGTDLGNAYISDSITQDLTKLICIG